MSILGAEREQYFCMHTHTPRHTSKIILKIHWGILNYPNPPAGHAIEGEEL